jgi:hypothetical protein
VDGEGRGEWMRRGGEGRVDGEGRRENVWVGEERVDAKPLCVLPIYLSHNPPLERTSAAGYPSAESGRYKSRK